MVLVKLLSKFRVQKKDSGGDRVRSGEISAGFPRLLNSPLRLIISEPWDVRVPLSKGREREGNEQIAERATHGKQAKSERIKERGGRFLTHLMSFIFHIQLPRRGPLVKSELRETKRCQGRKEGRKGAVRFFVA